MIGRFLMQKELKDMARNFPNEKKLTSFVNTLKDGILTEKKVTKKSQGSLQPLGCGE